MALQKTPVSLLQEIFAQQRKPLPLYQEDISDKPLFPFKCTVTAGSIRADGYAHTKKEAKHKCAQEALIKLGINSTVNFNNNNVTVKNNSALPSNINYVGTLNEHASGNQMAYPVYNDCLPTGCQFKVVCKYGQLETEGFGSTKKIAKQDSARLMLEKLKTEDVINSLRQIVSNQLQDDSSVTAVLDKYNSLLINDEKQVKSESQPTLPKIEIETHTMEELIEKLKTAGHACKLEVYQADPFIMSLKVDSCVTMGHGKTKKEAMEDLFRTTSIMYQTNFSFRNKFNRLVSKS